ncbi:MAG: T9SS type A sorting domain-containing protein, partial [Phycisphaerae bacterium]|nr:T9SS type A sorting domain-containing protein [Saprospiraceae bacterium]
TDEYYNLIVASCEYISGSTHLYLEQNPFAPNRIRFTPASECSSFVGMQGGVQNINLMDPFAPGNGGNGCYFPAIIHEIAHAAGLWHEQSRVDRDVFVVVLAANIQAGKAHNFDKHITDGTPIGPYDFASLMHYGPYAFSANGQPTIVALHGESFGNATEYSDGDIATINYLYPARACQFEYYPTYAIPSVSRPLVFEAGVVINANLMIAPGNNITYDGGQEILLRPGFETKGSTTFLAVIEGCGGVYQMTNSGDMDEWIYDAEQKHQNPESSEPTTLKPATTETTASVDATPNPFTTSTTIAYTLPIAQDVDIQIFNALGNLVVQPVRQEQQTAGLHEFTFEANGLPAGVYFLVMQTGGQKMTKRLVLSR